jgi:very-short-patch-repair endonuclease
MPHPNARLAHELRWNATLQEKRLWFHLRKRPGNYKFRRQVKLGPYIVDFASYAAKLVIEVDGEFHTNQPGDIARESWLRADGWEVARYWNRDVQFSLDAVLEDIESRLARLPPPPPTGTPAHEGRGD